jgi:hypothetical protein
MLISTDAKKYRSEANRFTGANSIKKKGGGRPDSA